MKKPLLVLAASIIVCVTGSSGAFARPGVIIRAGKPVPGEYIILVDPLLPSVAARAAVTARQGTVIMEFPDIHGFYVRMTESTALALTYDVGVRSVEENGYTMFAPTQTGVNTPLTSGDGGIVNASQWGLDRIDQVSPAANRLDNNYTYCSDGTGVRIYILDGGVMQEQTEFDYSSPFMLGRVEDQGSPGTALQTYLNNQGISFGAQCWTTGGSEALTPLASHGTAVASVAAGTQLGVAKGARIVDARSAPCNGAGTNAYFTAVIDWIGRVDPNRVAGRSVINISSAVPSTQNPEATALENQIAVAVDTYNIPVVAAAGNFNVSVFWYEPARAPRSITVGALSHDADTRWCCYTLGGTTFGSNYAWGTAFYAPGQRIEAASTSTRSLIPALARDLYRSELGGCSTDYADTCTSGTSFSAPIMTGVIARYLQRHPGTSRDSIVNTLRTMNQTYAGGACVTEPDGTCVPVLVFQECP